jgi:hypothetical protein
MDDELEAALAEIREQADNYHLVPAAMVLPLLAAINDILDLADGWTRESQAGDGARARDGAECAYLVKWAIGRRLAEGPDKGPAR